MNEGEKLLNGGINTSVSAPCAKHEVVTGTSLPKNRVNERTDVNIGSEVSPGFRYTAEVRSSHPTARWHANSSAVSVASFL